MRSTDGDSARVAPRTGRGRRRRRRPQGRGGGCGGGRRCTSTAGAGSSGHPRPRGRAVNTGSCPPWPTCSPSGGAKPATTAGYVKRLRRRPECGAGGLRYLRCSSALPWATLRAAVNTRPASCQTTEGHSHLSPVAGVELVALGAPAGRSVRLGLRPAHCLGLDGVRSDRRVRPARDGRRPARLRAVSSSPGD